MCCKYGNIENYREESGKNIKEQRANITTSFYNSPQLSIIIFISALSPKDINCMYPDRVPTCSATRCDKQRVEKYMMARGLEPYQCVSCRREEEEARIPQRRAKGD